MQLDDDLLDKLIEGLSPEEIMGKEGLLKEMTKRIMERALNGEMTSHLGYSKNDPLGNNTGNSRNGHSTKKVITNSGEVEIVIPRDRNGEFEPQFIEKGQRRFKDFDEKILSMYALGMTTRDIQYHLKDIYGINVSPDLISTVTAEVVAEVREWQERPLEPMYPIVYFDAMRVKVREDKKVINKAVYIALAYTPDGIKDILGMWISNNEGAHFWLNVMSELQNRGVEDILIASIDGLKGFPEAIEAIFPKTEIQLCIVHVLRNSYKYVSYKESKNLMADLKEIYKAQDAKVAVRALGKLSQKWKKTHPAIVKLWTKNWVHISVMFEYPEEIRKLIYTTNPIESVNASLRKVTKNKRVFPHDTAVFKQLYLAIRKKVESWSQQRNEWGKVRNQLTIIFEERFSSFTQ